MRMRDITMLVAGAAIGSVATVAVYAARGSGVVPDAELRIDRSSPELGASEGPSARTGSDVSSAGGSRQPDPASAIATGDPAGSASRDQLDSLVREKRQLETRLHALESSVGPHGVVPRSPGPAGAEATAQQSPVGAHDEFELDQEDWKKLAAEGRVKYKIPCLLPAGSPWTPQPATLDGLGLSPEDGEVIAEAHRRSNARVWDVIRPLCEEAIGDPATVDLLGGQGCMRVVQELAVAKDPMKSLEAQRKVAEVHAGLQPRPAPDQPQHPVFQMLMALTSEAKLFEADLAETFGPEDAKRIAQSDGCSSTMR
jgi:hypothetical protein